MKLVALVVIAMAVLAATAAPRLARTEPLVIGFIGTLSGPEGRTGLSCAQGVLLAVDDCNAAGGIRGRTLELAISDDRGDPATAAIAIHQLADRDTWAVIGPTTLATAQASADAAINREILLISPILNADAFKPHPMGPATVRLPSTVAAEYIARHVRFRHGLVRTAIVVDKSADEYVENIEGALTQALGTSGATAAGVIDLPSPVERDYRKLAQRLIGSGADSIVVVACGTDTALILQHLRAAGCEVPVLAYEVCSVDDLLAYAGPAAEGLTIIGCAVPNVQSARSRAFAERFQSRFGHRPDLSACHAYEAARLGLLSVSDATSPRNVRSAMLARHFFDALHGRISIGSSASPRREIRVFRVINGAITSYD